MQIQPIEAKGEEGDTAGDWTGDRNVRVWGIDPENWCDGLLFHNSLMSMDLGLLGCSQ